MQDPTNNSNNPTTPVMASIPDDQTSVPPLTIPTDTLEPETSEVESTPATTQVNTVSDNYFPPQATPPPKKKFGSNKIIATFLGLVLLVGGITAGLLIIRNPQLFKQQAATTGYDSCGTGFTCQNLSGGACLSAGGESSTCTSAVGATGSCCVPDATPVPSQCNDDADCPGGVGGGYLCRNNQCITRSTIINCDGTQCRVDQCHCLFGDTCSQRTCDQDIQRLCTEQGRSYCSNYQGTGMTCCEVGYICNPSGYGCVTSGNGTPPPTSPPGPTPTPPPSCNSTCTSNTQCTSGMVCNIPTGSTSGNCRNPSCLTSASCVCSTATPTPSPTPPITAACSDVKAYSATWTAYASTDLANLKSGNQVNFCVNGTAGSGTFDMARFTINGVLQPTTTGVRPGSTDLCQTYTIPAGVYAFDVTAEIHHVTLGWVGP